MIGMRVVYTGSGGDWRTHDTDVARLVADVRALATELAVARELLKEAKDKRSVGIWPELDAFLRGDR
jgi:hypothetical protein